MTGHLVPSIAVAAALVVGLSACSADSPPEPADSAPTTAAESSAPPAPPLTKQSMPSSDEMRSGLGRFEDPTDITDPAEMVKHECQQGEWADTGTPTADETSIRQRTWKQSLMAEAQVVLVQYATPTEAQKAYQTIAGWAADCKAEGFERQGEATPVSIGPKGEAQVSVYTSPPKTKVRPDNVQLSHLGVLQDGQRVVWVVVRQKTAVRNQADDLSLDATDENKHPYFAFLPKLSPVATR